ncbi:metalloregulator ArsR/SmtB family transcription factor [Microbacterium sp. NPDC090218]
MARAATTSDVFNAIAEPRRRDILALLRTGERPVTELSESLGMTQPGASKHLRVLREVGLVRDRREGKQRVYALDAAGLRAVHEWTGGFEQFWGETFDRLDAYVQKLTQERRQEQRMDTTTDREIVISRVIDAPRELVFEAFTEVRHLSRWWGPAGFTTTTSAFEFRVGGEWEFVLHGPDGTDYREWITWTEIVVPERIAMLHGEYRDDPEAFESVLAFVAEGAQTRVEMRTVFPTVELRDEAIEKHGAIEGGRQTLGNLADYAAELRAAGGAS